MLHRRPCGWDIRCAPRREYPRNSRQRGPFSCNIAGKAMYDLTRRYIWNLSALGSWKFYSLLLPQNGVLVLPEASDLMAKASGNLNSALPLQMTRSDASRLLSVASTHSSRLLDYTWWKNRISFSWPHRAKYHSPKFELCCHQFGNFQLLEIP